MRISNRFNDELDEISAIIFKVIENFTESCIYVKNISIDIKETKERNSGRLDSG